MNHGAGQCLLKHYISYLRAKKKKKTPAHTCYPLTAIVFPSNLQTALHLSILQSDRWERVRECWRETQTMKTGSVRHTKQESREKRRTAEQSDYSKQHENGDGSCSVMRWGSNVNIFSLILYCILIAKARQQHMQKWCGSRAIPVSHTTQTELSCDWLCVCSPTMFNIRQCCWIRSYQNLK